MITVRGRVVAVKPREQGTFSVTLGAGDDLFAYGCVAPPPKLGAELVLLAERTRGQRIV